MIPGPRGVAAGFLDRFPGVHAPLQARAEPRPTPLPVTERVRPVGERPVPLPEIPPGRGRDRDEALAGGKVVQCRRCDRDECGQDKARAPGGATPRRQAAPRPGEDDRNGEQQQQCVRLREHRQAENDSRGCGAHCAGTRSVAHEDPQEQHIQEDHENCREQVARVVDVRRVHRQRQPADPAHPGIEEAAPRRREQRAGGRTEHGLECVDGADGRTEARVQETERVGVEGAQEKGNLPRKLAPGDRHGRAVVVERIREREHEAVQRVGGRLHQVHDPHRESGTEDRGERENRRAAAFQGASSPGRGGRPRVLSHNSITSARPVAPRRGTTQKSSAK